MRLFEIDLANLNAGITLERVTHESTIQHSRMQFNMKTIRFNCITFVNFLNHHIAEICKADQAYGL